MRNFIATLAIVMLSFSLSAGTSHADTSGAQQFIKEHYFRQLPGHIVKLPWDEFRNYIDRYTRLMSPEELAYRENSLKGLSTGRIGIRRDSNLMGWTVTHVVPGGPAYYAGLRLGDVIYSADDLAISSVSEDSSHRRVTGPAGTGVTIEYIRNGKCRRTVIHRADIQEDMVYCLVQNRTLSVRITQFGVGVHDAFTRATAAINPSDIDTLVFDVRDNPGGFVDETIKLLSEFIEAGDTLIAEQYRHDVDYRYAEPFGRWRGSHVIVVMQDSNSASASEMFAGTLKVRRSAVIVGTTSYGKGRMQRIYAGRMYRAMFGDSNIAGISVTIGTYLAGGILPVDSIGVLPNVEHVAPIRKQGKLPDSFDVLGLRLAVDYPSKHLIDSVNGLGYGQVATIIWGDRVEVNNALEDLAAVRHRIPTPLWRCAANHDTLPTAFNRSDEEAIRRKLAFAFKPHLADSILQLEPVERLLQHVSDLARAVHGDELVLERARKGPTSADLGMKLDTVGSIIYVVDVVPGSPSYEAGVTIGDRIVFVNDKPLANLLGSAYVGLADAVNLNKPVRLTIRRGNSQFTVACKPHMRGTSVPVTYIQDNVGYIKTDRFGTSANVTHQVWSAMSRLRDSGAHTLVFDLRGSTGGTSDHVQRMMEHFARPGDTIMTRLSEGAVVQRHVTATYGGFAGWDIYILVDQHTADAAETFAYMMQHNKYATIVGTSTLGRMIDVETTRLTSNLELRIRRTYTGSTQHDRVQPDQELILGNMPFNEAALVAQQIGKLTPWRAGSVAPRADVVDDILQKLPSALRQVDRGQLAKIVFGGTGELMRIAPDVERVINQRRRYTRR
ncbi:MAG: S41 family peptidase [Ignavibacteria bacterium]